ncbi:MAG: mercury methylation corrinoid protein HgcA [Planctomycetota bacterium]|jgi:acetyl-CoA decarbonylase/synthase complex subunit gamma
MAFDGKQTVSFIAHAERQIPRVPTELNWTDTFGSWKARWGVGRMNYTVEPGLYGVGDPTADSNVFVTANYKMSFDRLRSRLTGRDGWILVLDTKGINVWCAAGKGTFGTEELVNRIEQVELCEIVAHKKLIVPQLGATGISAHEVKRQSGFQVVYGPVRAEDLPAFLDAGLKATEKMRRITFPLVDRIVLIPVELIAWSKHILCAAGCFLVLAGLNRQGYSTKLAAGDGMRSVLILLASYLAASILGPALLPWLPGRAFSVKGLWIGLAISTILGFWNRGGWDSWDGRLDVLAWFLIVPALTSFIVMNFTGASTYTSLSGVKRETRIALPAQSICAAAGIGLWLAGRFV